MGVLKSTVIKFLLMLGLGKLITISYLHSNLPYEIKKALKILKRIRPQYVYTISVGIDQESGSEEYSLVKEDGIFCSREGRSLWIEYIHIKGNDINESCRNMAILLDYKWKVLK